MLVAQNIKKSYGKLSILHGLDLSIQQGEIFSIVGASGAGKSTLLHILGTLEKPDEGSLHINQTNVLALRGNQLADFRNQQIGFVFQFHHLLPEFTAIENICIPAFIAGKNKSEAIKDAQGLLALLHLEDRAMHKPHELSGGEQQRIAIARALINKPAVVFADEPTGNLDHQHAQSIFEIMNTLRQAYQQTFVMVTHNQELAELSDRYITLEKGRIITT